MPQTFCLRATFSPAFQRPPKIYEHRKLTMREVTLLAREGQMCDEAAKESDMEVTTGRGVTC